jgi:hypothetical protein
VSAASDLPFCQSSWLTSGPMSVGGETLSAPAVHHFRVAGSQVRKVQHPAFRHPQSGEAQRPSWNLCAQLHPMARYQDRERASPSNL